ncbi:MAG: MFS transporter [Desulfurococcales archaeon]|nr:MFS transporter [Desulfurococcales archaeon]
MRDRSRRGVLLAGFMLATFSSQAIWVTFSPVSTNVSEYLGVSKERIGLLALVYPILFLALTLPSGILLDRRFKASFLTGITLTGLGGVLRLANPSSYEWLLACQIMAGIGQPFILNAFAPFSARFYSESKERVVSLLSLSMYLGIIYALGTGYTIYEEWGMYGLIVPIAVVSLASIVLVLSSINAVATSIVESGVAGRGYLFELRRVVRFRDLWMLGGILGLGVALFDNMSIWLEAVLAGIGLGHIAGRSLAFALIAGLIGISFIPAIVTRRNARTMYIRMVSLIAALSFIALALETTSLSVAALIPLVGFLMLPAYPIIMEWIATYHDPRLHGSATGFIGLTSRILTVVLASSAVALLESPVSYFTFLAVLSLLAFIIALLLPVNR